MNAAEDDPAEIEATREEWARMRAAEQEALTKYLTNESLTEMCQTKLTSTESESLDEAVKRLRAQGHKATRSSVIRACVRRGLTMYREEMSKQ